MELALQECSPGVLLRKVTVKGKGHRFDGIVRDVGDHGTVCVLVDAEQAIYDPKHADARIVERFIE